MSETPHRAGDVARPGHRPVCRHALPALSYRAIRAIRGQFHPLGEATSRRRHTRGWRRLVWWRRLVSTPPTPSKPTPSGTRRPSPYPQHQLLRGWRRLVSTPPTPSKPTPSGTRRPSPYPQHQLLRGWRRPVAVAPARNPKLSGTRRPSPYPHHQLLRGWRRLVSTPPTPSKPTPPGTRRPSPHPDPQSPRSSSSVRDFLLCPFPNPSSKP